MPVSSDPAFLSSFECLYTVWSSAFWEHSSNILFFQQKISDIIFKLKGNILGLSHLQKSKSEVPTCGVSAVFCFRASLILFSSSCSCLQDFSLQKLNASYKHILIRSFFNIMNSSLSTILCNISLILNFICIKMRPTLLFHT